MIRSKVNSHTWTSAEWTQQALEHLREARYILSIMKHPRTVARVRAAISSAKGAMRVEEYRAERAARAARLEVERLIHGSGVNV